MPLCPVGRLRAPRERYSRRAGGRAVSGLPAGPAACFDMDGVLVDSEQVKISTWLTAVTEVCRPSPALAAELDRYNRPHPPGLPPDGPHIGLRRPKQTPSGNWPGRRAARPSSSGTRPAIRRPPGPPQSLSSGSETTSRSRARRCSIMPTPSARCWAGNSRLQPPSLSLRSHPGLLIAAEGVSRYGKSVPPGYSRRTSAIPAC